jgi:citrate synthase
VYDPGYVSTACCKSAICNIDGVAGKLSFRGYAIEELVEKSTFVEVAFLLIYGSLPDAVQLDHWTRSLLKHSFLHNNLGTIMSQFRYDAHPAGMFVSTVAALGTFFPEANPTLKGTNIYKDSLELRDRQISRILGKVPTIAAQSYRHRLGRPYNPPLVPADPTPLGFTENFLYMLDRLSENHYRPHPTLVKALDKIWILHAEHGLNCSTATLRQLTSTGVDPYTAVAGAAAALYGNLHGGANEAVLRMLKTIGSVEALPSYLKKVKKEKRILFGFGHRVYKSPDPRATLLKKIALDVFEVTGTSPLLKLALEMEKLVLNDEYFTSRHLFPNVDFYSGLIYSAMDLPTDMFPVLFTIPLTAGWLAHWVEASGDESMQVFEPRQVYVGKDGREILDIESRNPSAISPTLRHSGFGRRRDLGTNFDIVTVPRSKL